MTPPPCNCAHVETLVVWQRADKEAKARAAIAKATGEQA